MCAAPSTTRILEPFTTGRDSRVSTRWNVSDFRWSVRTQQKSRDTGNEVSRDFNRRWRWDLNPRRSCPLTRFRGVLLRPLGHATAEEVTGRKAAGPNRAEPRRRPQGAWRTRSPAARRSLQAGGSDGGRGRRPTACRPRPSPRFQAPNTTRVTRASTRAPGTHRARLEGDHQRAAVEPPRSSSFSRRPQRDDLGVRCRIAVSLSRRLWPVSNRDELFVENDGTDRYVTFSRG